MKLKDIFPNALHAIGNFDTKTLTDPVKATGEVIRTKRLTKKVNKLKKEANKIRREIAATQKELQQ